MWNEAMHPMGWAGHGLGLFLMILFWVVVVVAAVYLLRGVLGDGRGSGPGETALEVLERRYAEGDIDEQEFQRKRADLTR